MRYDRLLEWNPKRAEKTEFKPILGRGKEHSQGQEEIVKITVIGLYNMLPLRCSGLNQISHNNGRKLRENVAMQLSLLLLRDTDLIS